MLLSDRGGAYFLLTILCFQKWDVYIYYFLKEYFPGINNEPYFPTLLSSFFLGASSPLRWFNNKEFFVLHIQSNTTIVAFVLNYRVIRNDCRGVNNLSCTIHLR